jgi:hypothetical protein
MSLSSKALEEASQKAYDAGERNPNALRGSLVGGTFGRGTGKFEKVEHELLGVKQLYGDEIEKVVNGSSRELRAK